MRRFVRHWKDAHPAASSVMATSATARSSANNRQPTPPPPPNSNSSNRERAEQGRAGDGTRTSFRRSPQYLLPVLRKITSENFENRLLFQGASLIEAMRRCSLSNGRLPSKRRTPQLTESLVFYFAYFPVSCPKTDAGFELSGARLPQNRRPLLGRKPGSGDSVFPLRGCTTGARGCPLESLA